MLKKAKKRSKNFELVMENEVLRIQSKGTERYFELQMSGKNYAVFTVEEWSKTDDEEDEPFTCTIHVIYGKSIKSVPSELSLSIMFTDEKNNTIDGEFYKIDDISQVVGKVTSFLIDHKFIKDFAVIDLTKTEEFIPVEFNTLAINDDVYMKETFGDHKIAGPYTVVGDHIYRDEKNKQNFFCMDQVFMHKSELEGK